MLMKIMIRNLFQGNKFEDIVIISFSFVELNTTKKRPTLVLLDTGDQDIVVAWITPNYVEDKYSYKVIDLQKADSCCHHLQNSTKLQL